MSNEQKLREAFEAHMTDGGKWPNAILKAPGGQYLLLRTSVAWQDWKACAEALALPITPPTAAPVPAVPQGNDPAWTLAAKVREALDRKSCPSYYMDVAVEAVVHNYTPAAPSQPVTLTDGLIERGALTGMVDAQIDSTIAALREKQGGV